MSSFEWVELETLTSDIEAARSRLAEARKRNNHGAIGALEVEITRAESRRSQLLAHISTNVASAAEPAASPTPKAGAGSRQASTPVAEAVPAEANAESPPDETASAAEPAPPPTQKDGAGSRQASAPVAEAVPDEANAEPPSGEPPPSETASAPAPATPPKAKDGANARQASAPAAEALQAEAKGEGPLPDRADRIAASGAASPASALKADRVEGGINMWDQLTPNDIERAKTELGDRRTEMLARHAEELKGLDADQHQLETLEQAITIFLRKFNPASPEAAVVKLDQERELRQQGNS